MLPPSPHNFILLEFDFDVKFPLLCLLPFLTDLKSTILDLLIYMTLKFIDRVNLFKLGLWGLFFSFITPLRIKIHFKFELFFLQKGVKVSLVLGT